MARFVLFAKTLCFDADQQVFYPLVAPAQRVALTPLQSVVLRRVLNAQGKLVRNQALHALFQHEPSELPFADRLAHTISEINRLAQLAQAPGAIIHQVPLIGCVLAEQVDVLPYTDAVSAPVMPAAASASASPAAMVPAAAKKKSWLWRGVIIGALLLNLALALLARQEFAPTGHDGTQYKALSHHDHTQVFIASGLEANSFVVQDALRRFREMQPRLADGAVAPFLYINKVRTRVFTSAFLCPKPITQKNNECVSWMVSVKELPDA